MFNHSSRKVTDTEIGTRRLEYYFYRPDQVVLGRIVEGIWIFGLENPLTVVDHSVGCSVGVQKTMLIGMR